MVDSVDIEYPERCSSYMLLDPHSWAEFFVQLGPEVVESFTVSTTQGRHEDGVSLKLNTVSMSVDFRDPHKNSEDA